MASRKSLIDRDGEVRELAAEDMAKFEPATEVLPLSLRKKLGVRGEGWTSCRSQLAGDWAVVFASKLAPATKPYCVIQTTGGGLELVALLYKRVIGLDIHQAQITACALIEEPDGGMRIEQRQFGRPHYNGVSR